MLIYGKKLQKPWWGGHFQVTGAEEPAVWNPHCYCTLFAATPTARMCLFLEDTCIYLWTDEYMKIYLSVCVLLTILSLWVHLCLPIDVSMFTQSTFVSFQWTSRQQAQLTERFSFTIYVGTKGSCARGGLLLGEHKMNIGMSHKLNA